MADIFELDRRYENDPSFRAMVDTLQGVIISLELSPSEIRAAAVYAAYRVEVRRAPPHMFRLDGEPIR